jgi:uncharacterized protein (TIGR02453 family)
MMNGRRTPNILFEMYFTESTFRFLKQLKRHNTREWFADNRQRYLDDVEAPMLQFIGDFAPRLKRISPAYVADRRRMGGSMFRIYRDTRFSPDKSPFKTWASARFQHEARKKVDSVPAFYLHIEPGEIYGGGGVYHIEMPALTRIRQHLAENPKLWAAVRRTGLSIEGESLTRPPKGFDASHPFIEDLKKKQLYTLVEFSEAEATSADFLDRYAASCERVAPLIEFLTKALGLRW